MSSDLFDHDFSIFRHSSSEMLVPSDTDLDFFSDSFSPFSDSVIDIFQAISNHRHPDHENPVEKSHFLDHFSPNIHSNSPPSQQFENLSLYQATHLQSSANDSNLSDGYAEFSSFDGLGIKNEECNLGFGPNYNNYDPFVPHSYDGAENVAKLMQRSYSSGSFNGKPGFLFQPRFGTLMESANFHNQAMESPENSFFTGQMRRVCSTGDLQNFSSARSTQRSFSSPLASENSFMDEANFKIGRYSAEERKERISKYRAKRTQRNFNKTIKYACRKTLADNRPRIRGRFARNDENGETPKAACSTRDEEEDELWVEGLNGEEEEETLRGGQYVNLHAPMQFQYYYGF